GAQGRPRSPQPVYGQPRGRPGSGRGSAERSGQAGYGQPQYGQYGPPMPPAQFGPANTDRRPGTATAASVLSYVQAGFLIISGIILLAGAGAASDFGNAFNSDTGSV